MKRAVKQIVMSETYRQKSKVRPEAKAVDPENRLLAYLPPRRLEAEFVRDNALAISGLLNRDLGGPSARPYQPALTVGKDESVAINSRNFDAFIAVGKIRVNGSFDLDGMTQLHFGVRWNCRADHAQLASFQIHPHRLVKFVQPL